MARKIKLYGTRVCPQVRPVRAVLDKAEIPYSYIDIQSDSKADEFVKKINNGNASVPTLKFPNGSTLTEPSTKQLIAKLEGLGYTVPPFTIFDRVAGFLANPFLVILGIVDIVLGVVMSAPYLIVLGLVMVSVFLIFGRILPALKARK